MCWGFRSGRRPGGEVGGGSGGALEAEELLREGRLRGPSLKERRTGRRAGLGLWLGGGEGGGAGVESFLEAVEGHGRRW
uniref:Uncharacterized protein n=1 Tax=Arundo donax TaxID=35708 RepID=A0A0A9H2C0_ARUDO